MNNEQNKPTELTEKELAGIVGGAGDLVTVRVRRKEEEWKEKSEAVEGGGSFVLSVSPADGQFFKTIICE